MKLCLNGSGEHFNLMNILKGLKIDFQQFQNMCIMAGCDYLANVPGVGIHRAYNIICSSKNPFRTLENKGAPKDYEEHFHETRAVFLHQTVFDVSTLEAVPLQEWKSDISVSPNTKKLCGKYPF